MSDSTQVLSGGHSEEKSRPGGAEGRPHPLRDPKIRVRFYWSSLFFACQRKGEDVLNGRKRKYLDFIDMLLEAKVRILDIFCI